MIVEYDLNGTKERHKGFFETTGFWIKCGLDVDDISNEVTAHKMWSHFGFTYESVSQEDAVAVYAGLLQVLSDKVYWDHPGIGYIRPVD